MAIDIEFVAGFGPIVRDPSASRELYQRRLGVAFQEEAGSIGDRIAEIVDGHVSSFVHG
jgi:hypothetical protein